jgi:HEPN domain-containing protein
MLVIIQRTEFATKDDAEKVVSEAKKFFNIARMLINAT